MATTSRIYIVGPKKPGQPGAKDTFRLVRATHPSNAVRHVAADLLTVAIATQDDLVRMVSAGGKVETIEGEQSQLPTT